MAKLSKDFLAASTAAFDEFLTLLIHLELCDKAVGWVNRNMNCLTIELFACEGIDNDAVLRKLDGDNLALTASELAGVDGNFIISADWELLNTMCFSLLLVELGGELAVLVILCSVEEGLSCLLSL